MSYSDTDEGVRTLIANHTVFAPESISETRRDPQVEGRWFVKFRAGRIRSRLTSSWSRTPGKSIVTPPRAASYETAGSKPLRDPAGSVSKIREPGSDIRLVPLHHQNGIQDRFRE